MKHSRKGEVSRVVALTVAGSDPSGGAGVQSDLLTFAAFGVHGFSALTAVIAQSSAKVRKIEPVSPAMLRAQIETVVAERMPAAIKIGALGSAANVRELARSIRVLKLPAPVIDPVMISSAGVSLLDKAGVHALIRELVPLARIVTPNIPEVEVLSGIRIDGDASLREAARAIFDLGAAAVVIKGGHRARSVQSVDLFFDGNKFVELRAKRLAGGGAHGTGCAFSAAIAAGLALGESLEVSVRDAKRYVSAALRASYRLGGRPLLEHFAARRR